MITSLKAAMLTNSFHLTRNPELIERLKCEMASAAIPKIGVLTRKHIQELPFLRCCLNESMS